MKYFKEDIVSIYQNERGILIFMILNFLLSIALMILAIVNFNPNASVIRVGYSDISGYQDGTWASFLAFPVLAIIFGIFHSLLAVRIYHKRGSGMAKFFLIITTALILGAILVFTRLLGES